MYCVVIQNRKIPIIDIFSFPLPGVQLEILSDTYIFEKALHECEPEVVSDSARVGSVDVLFVARRQVLSLLVFAAVPEH